MKTRAALNFTVVFAFWLVSYADLFPQEVTRGPYLQVGTPNSVIVRWRTNVATNSQVRFGTALNNLNASVGTPASTGEHEVEVDGLAANTKYFYAVGTSSQVLAGDNADHFFVTPPQPGTPKATRIWLLGDAGTKNSSQRAVRDAYYNFTGSRHTDLWIMLGDNAYNNGEDGEFQLAVFENMYEKMLCKSVLWATRGNHDRGPRNGSNWSNGDAYYNIFTLPTNGEAGGMASGSEGYYSFDHANIHFICLESTSGDLRAENSPQWTWLEADLAANNQDWTIAFWHHPPYSKGSHNSDSESELANMRERAVTRLEDSGVDMVFTGHSHSYERSYLLDGHYGKSGTLTSNMILSQGSGREDGGGAYRKQTLGSSPHEGAVYIVAGSSGKTSGGSLNHPAMFLSLNELGSVVLDIDGNRADAKFIDEAGQVRDYFTVIKGQPTAVEGETPETLPTQIELGQNYPNPFNPSTTISYSLPKAGTVTLAIYNLRGELVRKLVNGQMEAGRHRAVWDATDANGARVASGVYVYRLQSDGFSASRRLILSK
jgi:hypothetical protein